MKDYTPSKYTQSRFEADELWNCTGLVTLVKIAEADGFTVSINFGDHEADERERVTWRTVRRAVQEVDEALLVFHVKGLHVGNMLVIASNDEDWLADYHVALEELVEKAEVFA